jgi:threonine dehydrogenase-like Zn-dependent dehydrogenase
VAEHRLSLAVNGRENLLYKNLTVCRTADRAEAGQENGHQVAAYPVAIVGLGYAGLPTAMALHGQARRIIGIDSSEHRMPDILANDADLGGPDRERLAAALADGSLELTTDPAAAKAADAVIICVPTPVDSQQTPDLSALRSACATVVRHTRPGQVIILTGQPLTVFGSGQQVRCFCHVKDVVPALPRLIAAEAACGRAVNLGSTEQVSIDGLARRVISLIGSASGITRTSYLAAYGPGYEDLERRVPDCTLAADLVGFAATRDLDEIIRAVAAEQSSARPTAA